tara:strand:- start:18 stop:716 length:699 start_codon:yes stop_codon:yes gene_type:complete
LKFLSYLVHLFTVSGVLFSFLALIAAIDGNLPLVFFYLAIALFVDGIDGSLARIVDVKKNTPNINGEILDNIIDFLNYVFIPSFVIYWSALVPPGLELISVAIILTVSCYTFANNNIKTHDFYFSGFPALWNIVILYFFILNTDPMVNFYTIIALSVLTFIPIKYLHPFRVSSFRKTSLFVLVIWMINTTIILYFDNLEKNFLEINMFVWYLTNFYFLSLTVLRSIKDIVSE